jgi:signal transduction histidine kinase
MSPNPLPSGLFNRSLRAKITLSVILPLVIILGSFTAIQYIRHRRAVLKNLSFLAAQTGQVIENSLQQAMLSRDREGLQHTLDSIGENDMLRVIYLLDTSGRVVFASENEGVGTRLDNRDPTCQPCHKLSPTERPKSVVVTLPDGQRVFRSMNPIENRSPCQACHDPEDRLLGLLLTDISMTPLESSLASDFRETILWWLATILVTVLVANQAVGRFVIGRLKGLATAITDLGQGQLPPPLPPTQPDEIGSLANVFNTMTHQLRIRAVENRRLSDKLQRQSYQRGKLLERLITAQEDERKRVARELHDELGQALAGLSFQVKILENAIDREAHNTLEQLSQIRSLITQTSDRMYDLILALRPSALDDLGLAAALNAHADRMLSGSDISFEIDAREMAERLPPNLETALYRIFQEALSNIIRHANASEIGVTLVRNNGVFEGKIFDDGQGFIPDSIQLDGHSSRGLGLLGMQERVTQFGGQLDIISRPGGGTSIIIRIPLNEVGYE